MLQESIMRRSALKQIASFNEKSNSFSIIFADILEGIVPRGKVGCHEICRHSSCFSFFEKGIPLR